MTWILSFMRLCNVLGRFVASFADMAAPLKRKLQNVLPKDWPLNDKDWKQWRPSGKVDDITYLSVTLRWRKIFDRLRRMRLTNWLRATAKATRQDQESNWYGVHLIQECHEGFWHNPSTMLSNSLATNSTATLPRRNQIHRVYTLGLTSLDTDYNKRIWNTRPMAPLLVRDLLPFCLLSQRQSQSCWCSVRTANRRNGSNRAWEQPPTLVIQKHWRQQTGQFDIRIGDNHQNLDVR